MSKIVDAIAGIASTAGNTPALESMGETVSYRELIEAVRALATQFNTLGIERLALAADNSAEWIIVDLACQLAGVPLIPLPGFFTAQQMRHAVDSSGVDVLLSDQHGLEQHCANLFDMQFSPSLTKLKGLRRIRALHLSPQLKRVLLPESAAKITYTSGSTGQAKGVCLSVQNQYATATALNTALEDIALDRHLVVLPLATLLENVAGVYSALLRGALVVLPSLTELGWAGSSGLEIQSLASSITKVQPNSAVILPQILKGLISLCESERWAAPASLRFLAVGGARVAPELIQRGRTLGLPVYEGYGLSECGSVVSVNTPSADKIGSAGKVLSHCVVNIVDSELWVGGNVYQSYLGQESSCRAIAEVATGDLGDIDEDGFLWLRGRSKNVLVNSYGRNISPEWPESELLAQPSILQCMVFGDEQAYCSALIYPAANVSSEQVEHEISICNRLLPDYAQIKCWANFPVPLSSENGLLTANGRLRRHEILGHYRDLVASCYADDSELIVSKYTAQMDNPLKCKNMAASAKGVSDGVL